MLYLTFHIDDEPTEAIKEWQQAGSQTADFSFTFAPAAGGCGLIVETGGAKEVESRLEMDLEHCLYVREDPNEPADAFRWRTPQLRGAKADLHTPIGVNEIIFWIDGALMEQLQELGWERERADAYHYRFQPREQGVEIWVRNSESGESFHLTGDADWS